MKGRKTMLTLDNTIVSGGSNFHNVLYYYTVWFVEILVLLKNFIREVFHNFQYRNTGRCTGS